MKVKCGIYQYTEVEVEIDDKYEPLTHEDCDWNANEELMNDFYSQYFDPWGYLDGPILSQLPDDVLLNHCCIKSLDGVVIAKE